MGIWCMVTAALVLISTGAVWYRQGKYREKELADISAMLECILDDRELPENRSYEETISSKIQHQLYRLQTMTKGYHARLEQDRNSIKNLITEIAHQMRTPLANMETYLDFLGDAELDRQEREQYLRAVVLSERKMHFLAESFIKMSRLEHRIIQIKPVDTDLLLTLEGAAGQVKKQAEEQGVRIRTQFPEELTYAHDADWMGEAVYNLLDNAVKYSKVSGASGSGKTQEQEGTGIESGGEQEGEGSEVVFGKEQEREGNGVVFGEEQERERAEILLGVEQNEMFVCIWVRDYGIGIEEGEEAKVFQRFYRGKNAGRTEGFGLGLYLAREIVLLHGGFMKVKRENPGIRVEIYLER